MKFGLIARVTLCVLIGAWASQSQAEATNPEDFESFDLTVDFPPPETNGWNPTEAVDGWVTFGEVGAQGRPGNFFSIANGSLSSNTSQVLLIDSAVAESPGENMTAKWSASVADSAGAVTKTTLEWFPAGLFVGDQHRIGMFRSGGQGFSTWGVIVNFGNGFYGPLEPAPSAVFFVNSLDDGVPPDGCCDNREVIPGTNVYDPSMEQWWRLEVEEDNVLNTSRARAYIINDTTNRPIPGDEEGWTSPLLHEQNGLNNLDYVLPGGNISTFTNGRVEWDNFSIVSVGAPALLCDLNASNDCDAVDIDLMAAAVRDGTVDSKFNVDGLGNPNIPNDDDYEFLVTDSTMFSTGFGDADLNKIVNFNDFVSLSNSFGTTGTGWATGNFNTDTTTNFKDFVRLSNNFGQSFGAGSNVPEPAAIGVLGVLAVAVLRKRR